MIETDKKSMTLVWLLLIVILFSLVLTYYRSFISKDYDIIQSEELPEGEVEIEQQVQGSDLVSDETLE